MNAIISFVILLLSSLSMAGENSGAGLSSVEAIYLNPTDYRRLQHRLQYLEWAPIPGNDAYGQVGIDNRIFTLQDLRPVIAVDINSPLILPTDRSLSGTGESLKK